MNYKNRRQIIIFRQILLFIGMLLVIYLGIIQYVYAPLFHILLLGFACWHSLDSIKSMMIYKNEEEPLFIQYHKKNNQNTLLNKYNKKG